MHNLIKRKFSVVYLWTWLNINFSFDMGEPNDLFAFKINKDLSDFFRGIYYAPDSPGGFRGAWALYVYAKKARPDLHISLKEVENWLHSQTTYQLHKQPIRNFPRRMFRVQNIDEQW